MCLVPPLLGARGKLWKYAILNAEVIRVAAARAAGRDTEESPGFIGQRCRLTAGRGDPPESATETYRRVSQECTVRAKWCGPSGLKVRAHRALRRRRRRVNPIGSKAGGRGLSAFVLAWNGESVTRLRTPLEARSNTCPREMATQTQNPAYRVTSQAQKRPDAHCIRAFLCVPSPWKRQSVFPHQRGTFQQLFDGPAAVRGSVLHIAAGLIDKLRPP